MSNVHQPLVAVVGANGTVGAPLVDALRPHLTLRSLVRRPPKKDEPVRHVLVDFYSVDSLLRALRGVNVLFVACGTTPDLPKIEGNVFVAAREAGVQRVVRISAPKVDGVAVSDWHMECEAALAATGLTHVNIRPASFMQNWLRNAEPIRHFNRFASSAGGGRRNYVDVRDVAQLASRLIRGLVPWTSGAIEVKGPEALSHADVADRMGRILGRAINCNEVNAVAHRKLLARSGLPSWMVEHLVELDTLSKDQPEQGSEMLEDWLDTPVRTFDEFLVEYRASFAPSWVSPLVSMAVLPWKVADYYQRRHQSLLN